MADQLPIHQQHTESSTSSNEKNMHSFSNHREYHKRHGDLLRDSIIGFSDGITVPFALTAGMSAVGKAKIVILAGLAELFAGAISMGVGAFLASATERKHYQVEEARERLEVLEKPEEEEDEIYQIFEKYGINRYQSRGVVEALTSDEEQWIQFMMDFELKITKPSRKHACVEGVVMGISYFVGGLLPLIPYFFVGKEIHTGLYISIGVSCVVLLVFGYIRLKLAGTNWKQALLGALETLVLGSLAAGVCYGIVTGVNNANGL